MAARDEFFRAREAEGLALTFRDVRLDTDLSEVTPGEVSTASRFSRNVPLLVPVVSAAMDTVTEHKMATGMALLGGLGIIHKNLTPDEQARQVERVKFYMNDRVNTPIAVRDTDTIGAILRRREEKEWKFHRFPVLDAGGRLVGLLTSNDFDFCKDLSLTAREVMTVTLITGTPDTTPDQAYELMRFHKKKGLPLVNPDGTLAGFYTYTDLDRKRSGGQHNVDVNGQLRVGAAVGVKQEEALARAELLVKAGVDVIVVDSAHGGHVAVAKMVRELKLRYPTAPDIVGGNVSTAPCAKALADAGADGVKIGQGPGAICTTRVIAGTGCPQVTAIDRCEKALRGSGIPICGDGGLEYSGDITVAIASGAHSVMMGSMLAGTDETPGETVLLDGRQWRTYRGMGSLSAMTAGSGARERYQQGDAPKDQLVPEGIEGVVPYAGPLANLMHQYVEGLRRGMGYIGARTVDDLREQALFTRNTQAGHQESHPRIRMTQGAPNYQGGGGR